ncbi:MAG: hypothetical protein A2928_03130 [Candidatus Taylorbacteria bacterium RIFCSPLOWO2_01_FULL_45_15b]|uniref:Thioredoxin domain-containing protein n=1 Tax=Candidatus Taylorbacteria bacterium RIFCSPLOWO2_01_FULL_45_15b TaxID=1802319 RepID=A0A1G2NFW5_9BACT|nr:MAG: hypothetical protein A2928_03130 [Candidatus Taylorbacteria bacterium RIFCSPLOWO2_01_FULL_45_15b]
MKKTELVISGIILIAVIIGGVLLLKKTPDTNNENESAPSEALSLHEKAARYKKFVEISSPDGFVNTNGEPITIESLKGKVVLLDIWTYSCINCQRTLPYLNDWYEKYRGEGLEIIGLHTPEFAFEHKLSNVEKAVKDFKIEYPVVLDNDYSTWRAWGNQYWPRKYLIDIDGYVVYDHIGEGAYAETENRIVQALNEKKFREGVVGTLKTPTDDNPISFQTPRSPETYFGSLRNDSLANCVCQTVTKCDCLTDTDIIPNKLYLDGAWNITPEYAESMSADSKIIFKFRAQEVFLVADADTEITAKILLDGKEISSGAGDDVQNSSVKIKESQLYKLIKFDETEDHILEIVSPNGLRAYAFTFG